MNMLSPPSPRRRLQGEMVPLLADGECEDDKNKMQQQENRIIEAEKDFIVEELQDDDLDDDMVCDSSLQSGKFGYSRPAVIAVFFFPAIGGLLYGYDIGATSAALPALQSPSVSGVPWFNVIADSTSLQGFITAAAVLGAILGSLVCFRVEMWLGRRRELLVASVLYFTGVCLEVLSGIAGWKAATGITFLLLGRIIYGTGIGFAMHGAPAYISEMSPPHLRGMLVTFKEVFIVLGMFFGYVVGLATEDVVRGWCITYSVSIFPTMILFCGMCFMPMSARWLLLMGKVPEAKESIKFVTPNLPRAQMNGMLRNAAKAPNTESVNLSSLWGPSCKQASVAAFGIILLQQVTGQPSVLYYADTLLEQLGFSAFGGVLIGFFKLVSTLGAVFTVDTYGRRKLLLIGCWLMLAGLLSLGFAYLFGYVTTSDCNLNTDEETCSSFSSRCSFFPGCVCQPDSTCDCCHLRSGISVTELAIMLSMMVYIAGYQVGFGPVGWLLIGELFPLGLRGKAICVAVIVNFGANLIVTFLFPVEVQLIGVSTSFFIFAAIDLYAILFISYKLLETKGLTLEQIEALFKEIGEENLHTS